MGHFMELNGTKIDPERLYSPTEWAEISRRSLKTLAKNRSLRAGEPFVKLGRAVFYRGSDIISHIEGQFQATGRAAAIEHAKKVADRRAA